MTWIIIPNSGHYRFSQELPVSTSDCEGGVKPFAILNSMVMLKRSSAKIWRQVISTLLRSGMTLQLSEKMNLKRSGRSKRLSGGGPARTSVVPAKEPESQESKVDSFSRLSGSFAWLNRTTFSWRTFQLSLFGGWIPFLESWPKAGMMRNGVVSLLPELERITKDSGGGFWRTPDAGSHGNVATPTKCILNGTARRDQQVRLVDQVAIFPTPSVSAAIQGQNEPDGRRGQTLIGAARGQLWPTPTEHGNYNQKGMSKTSGDGLATAVHMFPTPTATDYKGSGKNENMRDRLDYVMEKPSGKKIGGMLNPTWVEWLMGYPSGYTDLSVWAIQ